MGRDRIIEDYIQRLSSSDPPITADTLHTLAQEVGLGPDDMAAVQQKSQAHLQQGHTYLHVDRLDDAIDELTQATTLDPLNFESLQTLAYAYDQRYGKHKKADDKKQALALAKRCQELHPNGKDAVVLISSLEHDADNRHLLIGLGIVALLIVVSFKPVMDIISTRSQVRQLTQTATSQEATAPSSNNQPDTEVSAAADTDMPDAEVSSTVNIPITFEQAGLTLDPRQSRLDNYQDASYHTLQGVLLNTGEQEIEALQLQIDYLDQDGMTLTTDSKDVIAADDATIRPGDAHAFGLIQKTTPELATVRFNVTTLDGIPAPNSYQQATPIEYTWKLPQPPQLTFELAMRNEDVNAYDISDSAYFDADWAITNTGETAIRQLKLQVNFYNQQGDKLLSEDILAVYGSDAPMLPGEVRPIRLIEAVAKDFMRYEVTVLEAE